MTTSGTSLPLEPDLHVFRGAPGGIMLLDTTASANADISDTNDIEVMSGETLAAVYSLGSSGAVMIIHVEGLITRGVS
ncbi:MAG TPA: hypothetical protein VF598_05010 [Hymenobacter sp.]